MNNLHSRFAALVFLVLCCVAAVFSQQNRKVTVTLVRWPYT
jgi:hypothetical protein